MILVFLSLHESVVNIVRWFKIKIHKWKSIRILKKQLQDFIRNAIEVKSQLNENDVRKVVALDKKIKVFD